jgi:hypothetical protein
MKKSVFIFAMMMLFVVSTSIASPVSSTPTPLNPTTNTARTITSEEAVLRIQEIKKMDFSKMSRSEKKEMRHELKQMKRLSDGIYLSGGALLVIIVLLILLL